MYHTLTATYAPLRAVSRDRMQRSTTKPISHPVSGTIMYNYGGGK